MSPWLKRSAYLVFIGLWLTGATWLVLHFFFQRSTEFGPSQNPWQPGMLATHGVLAALGTFLLGWISAQHVGEGWRRNSSRASGLAFGLTLALLVMTGVAIYYVQSGSAHRIAEWTHEIAGAVVTFAALTHWFRRKRRNRDERDRTAASAQRRLFTFRSRSRAIPATRQSVRRESQVR